MLLTGFLSPASITVPYLPTAFLERVVANVTVPMYWLAEEARSMWIIEKIFRRRAKGYSRPIKLRYRDTLVFEGYSRTGDKLFTKERTPLPSLIYHAFVFALDAGECEIWVKDDAKTRFERDRSYRAYLNADGTYCWFHGQEALVRRGEAGDGGEDGVS